MMENKRNCRKLRRLSNPIRDTQRGHLNKDLPQEKSRWRPGCFHCGHRVTSNVNVLSGRSLWVKPDPERVRITTIVQQSLTSQRRTISHPPGATNSHIKGARGAYLKIVISLKCQWALLDTGGEVSIAPKSVVPKESIFPSTQSLRAANGPR